MAASCFAIPLSSSSRSSNNSIPKYKTIESFKPQFPSSSSFFHLSCLSRPFVAQSLQIKVSSSDLSVLDEEEVKGEGETDGDSVVSEAEPVVMKKPRPCELYVCNIPRSYDIAQLLDMFQPFGTVISVEVSRNPQTGESRGSGYVTMGSINSAKIAIASLDGTEVGGREMRVRYSVDMNPGTRRNPQVLNSTPKKILMYESQYKIYVGNLPWFTQPDGLRDHFSKFGTIVSTRVLHDRKTGKNRVFAFLSFTKSEERDAALSLNGTVNNMKVAESSSEKVSRRASRKMNVKSSDFLAKCNLLHIVSMSINLLRYYSRLPIAVVEEDTSSKLNKITSACQRFKSWFLSFRHKGFKLILWAHNIISGF